MGKYYISGSNEDPRAYLKENFDYHYSYNEGGKNFGGICEKEDDYGDYASMLGVLKEILQDNKPAVIGGNAQNPANIFKDHYIISVSYIDDNTGATQYIIIDPWYEKPCWNYITDFKNVYPYPAYYNDKANKLREFKEINNAK